MLTLPELVIIPPLLILLALTVPFCQPHSSLPLIYHKSYLFMTNQSYLLTIIKSIHPPGVRYTTITMAQETVSIILNSSLISLTMSKLPLPPPQPATKFTFYTIFFTKTLLPPSTPHSLILHNSYCQNTLPLLAKISLLFSTPNNPLSISISRISHTEYLLSSNSFSPPPPPLFF